MRLADLQAKITDFEQERAEIKSEGGATLTSPAPKASRLAELDIVIDDLRALEDAIQTCLRGNG